MNLRRFIPELDVWSAAEHETKRPAPVTVSESLRRRLGGLGFGPTASVPGGTGNLCGSAACGVKLAASAYAIIGIGTNLMQDGLSQDRTYIENSATFTLTLAPGFSPTR